VSTLRVLQAACLLFALGFAQDAVAQHDHGHGSPPSGAPPSAAPDDPAPFGSPVMDQHVFYHLILNQLEGRFGDSQSFRWSGEAWAGTDTDRVWLRSEGR